MPAATFSEILKLEDKLKKARIPSELSTKASGMLERLRISLEYGGNLAEFDNIARYIDWIISLPWDKKIEENKDLAQVRRVLDSNHYGLIQIKERILEYLAVLILQGRTGMSGPILQSRTGEATALKSTVSRDLRAPILCLEGLVGTGKTTLAYSIAESLGRPFARIPFGGMGGAANLRGQSRVYPDSEPGLIVKSLKRVQAANSVFLLDEIDRVSEESRSDIMGVLVELLDPEQNFAFLDHYIDFPIDLSQVLFIATANNITNIATAVLDRLEIIQMPSYSDEEKIVIGKKYILPRALAESSLSKDGVKMDEAIWPKIVRPLGFDPGMRSLERTIYGICRKVAKLTLEEKVKSVKIDSSNLSSFIPSW